jgi:hypothetical protein
VRLSDDRTTDERVVQLFNERSMRERSQRLRHTPIPPGVATIPAWLGSKCLGATIVERAGEARRPERSHVGADSDRSLVTPSVIWITAVRFDRSGHEKHENICAFRWRAADSQHHGRYTVAELIDVIRANTLVYVSDDAFERTALVRVVDAESPYVRSWAHGGWGNDLLALPRFDD